MNASGLLAMCLLIVLVPFDFAVSSTPCSQNQKEVEQPISTEGHKSQRETRKADYVTGGTIQWQKPLHANNCRQNSFQSIEFQGQCLLLAILQSATVIIWSQLKNWCLWSM